MTASRVTCTTTSSRNCSPSGSNFRVRPPAATRPPPRGSTATLTPSMRSSRRSAPASSASSSPLQPPASLQARVMEIVDEHTSQLGFTASVSFAGAPGPSLDETLTHDILAVTREALSNCARHAHATAVSISLARARRADHPRGHRQRPRPRHARQVQRPGQHAPPRGEQLAVPSSSPPPPVEAPASPGPPAQSVGDRSPRRTGRHGAQRADRSRSGPSRSRRRRPVRQSPIRSTRRAPKGARSPLRASRAARSCGRTQSVPASLIAKNVHAGDRSRVVMHVHPLLQFAPGSPHIPDAHSLSE